MKVIAKVTAYFKRTEWHMIVNIEEKEANMAEFKIHF